MQSLQVQEPQAVDPHTVVTKLNAHIVRWFFALGICCYLDRTNLAFAAFQLSADLALPCSVYGLGAGLFFVGYASLQIPSNMVIVRLGAPLWLSVTVAVWGCVAAGFAFVNSTVMFLVLRFALGVAECGTFPGIWYHLSLFYSTEELGQAYSKVASSTALAQVIGAPIAALILSLNGLFGLKGWQWLFLIEGGSTLVFAAALRLCLAPSPADSNFLTPAERDWLRQRQDSARLSSSGPHKALPVTNTAMFSRVARNWRVWYLSGVWLLVAATMNGIIFFCPLIIHAIFTSPGTAAAAGVDTEASLVPAASPDDTELSPGCSGEGKGAGNSGALLSLLTVIPFATAAVAMIAWAKISEAANERHRHTALPLALSSVCLALTPLAMAHIGPSVAFLCLIGAAAFTWAFHGPFMSWPAVFLPGAEGGIGFAMINSLGSLGGFLGPSMLGMLADRTGGYGLAMSVLAGSQAVSAVAILMFPERGCNVPVVFIGEGEEEGGKESEVEPILAPAAHC